MKRLITKFVITFLLLLSTTIASAFEPVERRKEQFDTTSGYLVIPAPYEFPGIGSGLMLIANFANLYNTTADSYFVAFEGDAVGQVFQIDKLFFIPDVNFLYLTFQSLNASKFALNNYQKRGMNSHKDDYNILIGDQYKGNNIAFTTTFFDRRLQFQISQSMFQGRTNTIKDTDNTVIAELSGAEAKFYQENTVYKMTVDFTDDYKDPRAGFKVEASFSNVPKQNNDSADYDVLSYTATYYHPMLKSSTWLFHYFGSQAQVNTPGNTDLDSLKNTITCVSSLSAADCKQLKSNSAQNRLNANKNGTAMSLGGADRLRSYPGNRYAGAHTRLIGTEFRWNINTEKSNLDWVILNDVQQALQLVAFAEQGSVAENAGNLGDITRHSYGSGIRLVTRSGAVYRFSLATGDEGEQVIMFFNHPWGLNNYT